MSVNNQPTSINFLSPLGYKFILSRAPNVEYFIQEVTLPGLNLAMSTQVTPFANVRRPGDKLDFEQLQVSFRVNENLDNYLEIFNWMIALGRPEGFNQYKLTERAFQSADEQKDTVVSDITLSILSSAMNSNVEFRMRDCFPISLSNITMTSSATDVDYVTATATFALTDFTITAV
jgi:hypothetical protein